MSEERMMDEQHDVVVVGGGIGGLLTALSAQEAGARVLVLEAHDLGGRARTDDVGGFTFNRGPRALYVGGPAERALRHHGIDTTKGGRPLLEKHPGAIHHDELHRFPTGPIGTMRSSLFTAREKAASTRALLPLLRDPGPIDPALSLTAWLDQRRASGAPRAFVEAMVRVATYVNAPEIFPAALALAQARGAATTGVRYLDGGFGSLVDALADLVRHRGIEVRDAAARTVRAADGRWQVATDTARLDAASVVLAVGLPDQAASILGDRPASWGELAPPPTAACLELGVRGVPHRRFCLGIDEPTYLSVHSPPARLAPEGHSVVHVMRYRPIDDPLDREQVRAQLDRIVARSGIEQRDIVEERFLASMVVSGTTPTAGRGLAGRPAAAIAELPGAFVVGDWVGPDGLLLDAVAASAGVAGEQAAARCTTMART